MKALLREAAQAHRWEIRWSACRPAADLHGHRDPIFSSCSPKFLPALDSDCAREGIPLCRDLLHDAHHRGQLKASGIVLLQNLA